VEWLPAYAPELNPDEQVWNHSKYSQLANFIADNVEHLAEAVTNLQLRLGHNLKRI
jgi:transposase